MKKANLPFLGGLIAMLFISLPTQPAFAQCNATNPTSFSICMLDNTNILIPNNTGTVSAIFVGQPYSLAGETVTIGDASTLNIQLGSTILVNNGTSFSIPGSGKLIIGGITFVSSVPGPGQYALSLLNTLLAAIPNGQTVDLLTAYLSLLPVTVNAFTATPGPDHIRIDWTTGSEFNNDYMAVERSANGVNFFELGRVKGLGTTDGAQDYQFIDNSPLKGVNYYRLRQVDLDKTVTYHPIASVVYDGAAGAVLQVFPNPAGEQLQLRWNGDATQPADLRVLDLSGRVLSRYNLPEGMLHYDLNLKNLQSGVYLLQVVQGNTTESIRFVKQ